jgi:hypothetical protein
MNERIVGEISPLHSMTSGQNVQRPISPTRLPGTGGPEPHTNS